MIKKSLVGVILFACLIIASQSAVTVTHVQTGLKFDIPDDWEYSQEGDGFQAVSPDESVILFFYVGKTADVADILDNIALELDGIIEDPEISEDIFEEEVNGLTQVYVEGTGYYQGEIVDWDLTMVFGGTRSMSIIGLGNIDDMQSVITDIYASVRR